MSEKLIDEKGKSVAQPNRAFLTDKGVAALRLPDGKSKLIANDSPDPNHRTGGAWVLGFGVRLTRGGARTFIFRYSGDRTIAIGPVGPWNVRAARDRARELRRIVDSGGDPQTEKAEKLAAASVDDLFAGFVRDYGPSLRPRTVGEYQKMYDRRIKPAMGRRKAASITFADVEKLHIAITRSGAPFQANRVVALLSRLFSLAVRRGVVAASPARGIERNQEPPRRRYLKPAETVRVLEALKNLKHRQSADALRLLMLTGSRKGETLAARWEQIDFDSGVWTKPGATTKQTTEHAVPLSGAALALLRDMHGRRTSDDWIFPAHGCAKRTATPRTIGHQENLKSAWESVRKAADVPDLRMHDLRHSFASMLASGGASLPLIGALLGHTQAATTARYAHLLDDPQRAAADRVGALLNAAETGASAEVIRFPVGGAA